MFACTTLNGLMTLAVDEPVITNQTTENEKANKIPTEILRDLKVSKSKLRFEELGRMFACTTLKGLKNLVVNEPVITNQTTESEKANKIPNEIFRPKKLDRVFAFITLNGLMTLAADTPVIINQTIESEKQT